MDKVLLIFSLFALCFSDGCQNSGFYLLARFEGIADKKVYSVNRYFISGHSLEHLFLAVVSIILTVMLCLRSIKIARYPHNHKWMDIFWFFIKPLVSTQTNLTISSLYRKKWNLCRLHTDWGLTFLQRLLERTWDWDICKFNGEVVKNLSRTDIDFEFGQYSL